MWSPIQLMNSTSAAVFRLVVLVLMILFTAGASKAETYKAVVTDFSLSFNPPDPLDPFKNSSSNLHMTDMSQVSAETTVYFSVRFRFLGDTSGQWLSVSQPNFPGSNSFTMMGQKEQGGGVRYPNGLGGAQNISIAGSVYTGYDYPKNPNPTTGGAWIYGKDVAGNIVTPTGSPIKDPGAVPFNGGAYMVNSNPNLRVYEFSVIGARRKFGSSFVSGVNNLRAQAALTGAKFNLFVDVTSSIGVDSVLGPTEGCKCYLQYPEWLRFPTIYVGDQFGPVKLDLQILSVGNFLIKNGRLSTMILQRSGDLRNWYTVPAVDYSISNLVNGDTALTMIGLGSQTTHLSIPPQDGPNCFYRLAYP